MWEYNHYNKHPKHTRLWSSTGCQSNYCHATESKKKRNPRLEKRKYGCGSISRTGSFIRACERFGKTHMRDSDPESKKKVINDIYWDSLHTCYRQRTTAASKKHSNSQTLNNLREGNYFAEELIALKKGVEIRILKYSQLHPYLRIEQLRFWI